MNKNVKQLLEILDNTEVDELCTLQCKMKDALCKDCILCDEADFRAAVNEIKECVAKFVENLPE